jgi:hypothetical protein
LKPEPRLLPVRVFNLGLDALVLVLSKVGPVVPSLLELSVPVPSLVPVGVVAPSELPIEEEVVDCGRFGVEAPIDLVVVSVCRASDKVFKPAPLPGESMVPSFPDELVEEVVLEGALALVGLPGVVVVVG